MFRVLSLSTAAMAAVALWAGPASAQYQPIGLKGWALQQQMLRQQTSREQSRAAAATLPRYVAPTAAAPAEVQIAIREPAAAPATVTVRGPDGEVRTFPVEGGRAALQTRVIVLRPGERVTVQLRPAGPARP